MPNRIGGIGWSSRVLAVVLALPVLADGVTHYVDNQIGRDVFSGRTPVYAGHNEGPFRTLQRALDLVLPGDSIVLMPTGQPYREQATLDGRRGGLPNFPILIEGNGQELVGLEPIASERWEYLQQGVYRLDGMSWPVGPLWLDGAPSRRRVLPANASPTALANQENAWLEGALFLRLPKSVDPRRMRIEESRRRGGLILHRASHVIVRRLKLTSFAVDAAQVHGPAHHVRFDECLFQGSERAGLTAMTNVDLEINRCQFRDNRGQGLRIENFSEARGDQVDIVGSPEERFVDDTSKADWIKRESLQLDWAPTIERPLYRPGTSPELPTPAAPPPTRAAGPTKLSQPPIPPLPNP